MFFLSWMNCSYCECLNNENVIKLMCLLLDLTDLGMLGVQPCQGGSEDDDDGDEEDRIEL